MKQPFKALWSEFKAFAFKGNMIDLAVAVVIGAAFSSVINSLVKDVIMPTVSYAVTGVQAAKTAATEAAHAAAVKVGATSQPASTLPADGQPVAARPVADGHPAAQVASPPAAASAPADPDKPVSIEFKLGRIKLGNFIAELLNFVIVAFAVFLIIVKLLGSVMKRVGGTPAPSEPTTKECPECLSVIPLKARRCPNCTSQLVLPGSGQASGAAG